MYMSYYGLYQVERERVHGLSTQAQKANHDLFGLQSKGFDKQEKVTLRFCRRHNYLSPLCKNLVLG